VPGEVGHPRVGFDPEHPAAGRPELPGFFAGTDAHVEKVGTGAGGNDPFDHGARVVGPGPIVAFGIRAERLGNEPVSMKLVPGRRFGRHAPIVVGGRQLINRVVAFGAPDTPSLAPMHPPS
jgi:hypothetical protein